MRANIATARRPRHPFMPSPALSLSNGRLRGSYCISIKPNDSRLCVFSMSSTRRFRSKTCQKVSILCRFHGGYFARFWPKPLSIHTPRRPTQLFERENHQNRPRTRSKFDVRSWKFNVRILPQLCILHPEICIQTRGRLCVDCVPVVVWLCAVYVSIVCRLCAGCVSFVCRFFRTSRHAQFRPTN